MQVTAQGYARLADKLQADIAVLEGGYSIESALPYVNTGIILAMAGMDYSKVVEPDLRGLRPQDERCNKRIDQLIAEVGDLYFNRERTSKELLAKCGNIWQRSKHIYYDEEGIREEQVESVHYCERKACRGYFTLQTAAEGTRFGDQSAFITCLTREICSHCRQKAYDAALAEKKRGRWQYVLVQDIATGTVENL